MQKLLKIWPLCCMIIKIKNKKETKKLKKDIGICAYRSNLQNLIYTISKCNKIQNKHDMR